MRRQSFPELFARSLAFNLAFFLSNFIGCFLLLWGLLLPRGGALRVVTAFFRWCGLLERTLLGLNYSIDGMENIPNGGCVMAIKHQSLWETYKLLPWFGNPAVVLKREIMRIPLWGWYAQKVGMIPIDRAAGASALLKMAAAAKKFAGAGRPIIIFPQGTRLRPGEWRAYRTGAAVIAKELGLPIVPVALNSGLYWPKRSFLKRAGVVQVKILAPIAPEGSARELTAKIEAVLEPASEQLSLAAGGPPTRYPSRE